MIRDDVKAAEIAAMKVGDKPRVGATRQILARIKDREIELRPRGGAADDNAMAIAVLQKMVKQRRESIALYEQGGRDELAAIERAEVAVIEEFLPAQMDEAALAAAIDAIITETGATEPSDMGRVMALTRERYSGAADMSQASALVKDRLSRPQSE